MGNSILNIKREEICGRIRDARKSLGLTQKQIGDKLGIVRPAYASKETGRTQFSVAEIAVLSEVLGKSVEWLITGFNEQKKDVLTSGEARLVGAFRQMDSDEQNAIMLAAMDLILAAKMK